MACSLRSGRRGAAAWMGAEAAWSSFAALVTWPRALFSSFARGLPVAALQEPPRVQPGAWRSRRVILDGHARGQGVVAARLVANTRASFSSFISPRSRTPPRRPGLRLSRGPAGPGPGRRDRRQAQPRARGCACSRSSVALGPGFVAGRGRPRRRGDEPGHRAGPRAPEEGSAESDTGNSNSAASACDTYCAGGRCADRGGHRFKTPSGVASRGSKIEGELPCVEASGKIDGMVRGIVRDRGIRLARTQKVADDGSAGNLHRLATPSPTRRGPCAGGVLEAILTMGGRP